MVELVEPGITQSIPSKIEKLEKKRRERKFEGEERHKKGVTKQGKTKRKRRREIRRTHLVNEIEKLDVEPFGQLLLLMVNMSRVYESRGESRYHRQQ